MNELIESVISYEALYESMRKCMLGVLWKRSTSYFYLNAHKEIRALHKQLKNGKYKPAPPKSLTITHPKKRDIVSISFRDRVYQRSLNDNVIYPIMTKSFIYQNFACQKYKGIDTAIDQLTKYLRRAYINNGLNNYVLQCDIKGYYPNMDHEVVERMFSDKLPPEIFKMVQDILHHQYPGDVGYNPGSQLIQIAGIALLDPLDHYIKERLHIKMYLRYMDDFVLIHPDKEYLEYCKKEIERWLNNIGFQLHETKTKVYPVTDGIKMLGFTHRLTDTGKVLHLIDSDNVRNERRKLKRLVAKVNKGILTKDKVDQCYESWKAHARKGNTFKLLQRMDEYYKNLWRSDRRWLLML